MTSGSKTFQADVRQRPRWGRRGAKVATTEGRHPPPPLPSLTMMKLGLFLFLQLKDGTLISGYLLSWRTSHPLWVCPLRIRRGLNHHSSWGETSPPCLPLHHVSSSSSSSKMCAWAWDRGPLYPLGGLLRQDVVLLPEEQVTVFSRGGVQACAGSITHPVQRVVLHPPPQKIKDYFNSTAEPICFPLKY